MACGLYARTHQWCNMYVLLAVILLQAEAVDNLCFILIKMRSRAERSDHGLTNPAGFVCHQLKRMTQQDSSGQHVGRVQVCAWLVHAHTTALHW